MPYFTNRGITPLPVGGGAWSPLTVSAAFWYDASNAGSLSVDGSNFVLQWNDLSGHSLHLTPTSGAINGGTLTASVQNSLAGVMMASAVGAGTNPELSTSSALNLAQPFTIVAAIKTRTSQPGFATLIDEAARSGTRPSMFLRASSLSNQPVINDNNGNNVAFFASGILADDTAYTLYGRWSGGSSSAGVNGVNVTGTLGAADFDAAISLAAKSDSLAVTSYILEIFGYSGVGDTEKTAALSYLTAKWAI